MVDEGVIGVAEMRVLSVKLSRSAALPDEASLSAAVERLSSLGLLVVEKDGAWLILLSQGQVARLFRYWLDVPENNMVRLF